MYRVEIGRPNAKGFYDWKVSVRVTTLSGRSRQPLLDACREIKRMGRVTGGEYAGLYREGKDEWDLRCKVDWGAARTVDEKSSRFRKWMPWNPEQLKAAE